MPQDPKKRAYWTEHHSHWQASGLSQRQYCQRESLSLSSFDRWRRLIHQASDAGAGAKALPKTLTLVPVQVGGASGVGGKVVLHSPAGWQVTLPDMLDRDMLLQLLTSLP